MRSLKKNKQRLYYATYSDEIPVYETGEDGKIKYTEVDGELSPIPIGTMAGYNEPVIFMPTLQCLAVKQKLRNMALISAHIRQFWYYRTNLYLSQKQAEFGTPVSHSTMKMVQRMVTVLIIRY